MTSKEWKTCKLSDFMEFNPRETLAKGTIAKKIAMENLQPFCRDVCQYEYAPYNGGVKFKNGDTIMARITPCLENGKTSKINILEEDEIAFGSTESLKSEMCFCFPDFVTYQHTEKENTYNTIKFFTSVLGGLPNIFLYSRLNCVGLSYPTI